MGRFLLFISYLGSKYSGLAAQRGTDCKTVIGVLENTCRRLHPANDVRVQTSSRTDKGVHALRNSVHVDLTHSQEDQEYDPCEITSTLNRWLRRKKEDIRVIETHRVSDDFHSRFQARHRTYLYRFMQPTAQQPTDQILAHFPITDDKRAFTVLKPLDMEKMAEASDILQGTHDFTSFSTSARLKENWHSPVKTLQIHIQREHSTLSGFMPWHTAHLETWNFIFKSQSFLYHQIRHITGILLGVGLGGVTLDTVRYLLNNPGEKFIDGNTLKILTAPAHGLYLVDVDYNTEDYVYAPATNRNIQTSDLDEHIS